MEHENDDTVSAMAALVPSVCEFYCLALLAFLIFHHLSATP